MRKGLAIGWSGLLVTMCVALPCWTLDAGPEDVYVRVVDVGAGMCCVVKLPGESAGDDFYIVYDAGNYEDKGRTAMEAIRDIIPEEQVIDLLVLSHTDSDHNGAVPDIVNEYYIDRILRTGMKRYGYKPKTLDKARTAVKRAVDEDGTVDTNLNQVEFLPGSTFQFGDALVTMVCGFGELPEDWDLDGDSEKNNAGSIVIRIQYEGGSILFCGDAVGRHVNSGVDVPIATEKYMVDQKESISIDSDVLVAPHHGTDGASSTEFLEAVSPDFVIFSAGHKYAHPRASAVERYTDAFNPDPAFFRTDRGDNEGGAEWTMGNTSSPDAKGDDDVEIVLREDGTVEVEYRDP